MNIGIRKTYTSLRNQIIAPKGINSDFMHFLESNKKLESFQKNRAKSTFELINYLIDNKKINPAEIKEVCDFGSGTGGPCLAILKCFNLVPSSLVAVENSINSANEIISKRILPQQSVITIDGLEYLSSGKRQFDLITANMLDPDFGNGLFLDFLKSASKSLKNGGKLLINSDVCTMKVANIICTKLSLDYEWLPLFSSNNLKDTIIIILDSSNLSKIKLANADKLAESGDKEFKDMMKRRGSC